MQTAGSVAGAMVQLLSSDFMRKMRWVRGGFCMQHSIFGRAFSAKTSSSLVFVCALALFCIWAAIFIAGTATLWNGQYYFSLFDDEMISMRFAWNFVHGYGLVWNPGEHVEGYTNPAWTMVMAGALAAFGDRFAPLAMQILGGAFEVVGLFYLTQSARLVALHAAPQGSKDDVRVTVLTLTLLASFYPLHFTALSGMEVAPLVALTAISLYCTLRCMLVRGAGQRELLIIICCGTTAYFLRPDGFINMILPFAVAIGLNFQTSKMHKLWGALLALAVSAVLVVAHLAVRKTYYGALVPNTYTLKVEGYGLVWRLRNGLGYIREFAFVYAAAITGGLVAICIALNRKAWSLLLLLAMPVIPILYQIYVGGDPWPIWRQLVPGLSALIAGCAVATILAIREMPESGLVTAWYRPVVLAVAFFSAAVPNFQMWNAFTLHEPPFQYKTLWSKTRTGLALRAILRPEGTVLVYWSGALPYYWQGRAIDALGKSNSYIAHLPPHILPAFLGMKGVPGHSKYDLAYSIGELQPDYIEGEKFGADDQSRFVAQHYVNVLYKGEHLCMKKNSPYVDWKEVLRGGPCSEAAE